jgi:hypothetical protein
MYNIFFIMYIHIFDTHKGRDRKVHFGIYMSKNLKHNTEFYTANKGDLTSHEFDKFSYILGNVFIQLQDESELHNTLRSWWNNEYF